MSKTIYIIIAVVVLVGGFFLVTVYTSKDSQPTTASDTKKDSQPTTSSDAKKDAAVSASVATNMVNYDGTAFTPGAIEVKVGDTVTFTNQGVAAMWVASGPHPTHTIYPEFDAKKIYNPNEAYTFTFDKAGTWKYHNHSNPTAFGSVTVK